MVISDLVLINTMAPTPSALPASDIDISELNHKPLTFTFLGLFILALLVSITFLSTVTRSLKERRRRKMLFVISAASSLGWCFEPSHRPSLEVNSKVVMKLMALIINIGDGTPLY
jgi:hypothetical protein